MARPGTISLSKDSLDFMRSNFTVFLSHLVFVFPLMILIGIVKQALIIYGLREWLPITILPALYVYACFALSWHRVSLNGPDTAAPVNPLMPKRGDARFLLMFIIVTGVFSAFVHGLTLMTEVILPQKMPEYLKAGQVFAFIAMVAAFYLMLRVSFIFPALSQDVRLTKEETLRASSRLTWPLFGVLAALTIMFVVVFSVYTLVAGMIATVIGAEGMDRLAAAATGLVLSAPVHIALFFTMAIYVTALSKAYRWGMGHNPL